MCIRAPRTKPPQFDPPVTTAYRCVRISESRLFILGAPRVCLRHEIGHERDLGLYPSVSPPSQPDTRPRTPERTVPLVAMRALLPASFRSNQLSPKEHLGISSRTADEEAAQKVTLPPAPDALAGPPLPASPPQAVPAAPAVMSEEDKFGKGMPIANAILATLLFLATMDRYGLRTTVMGSLVVLALFGLLMQTPGWLSSWLQAPPRKEPSAPPPPSSDPVMKNTWLAWLILVILLGLALTEDRMREDPMKR